MSGAYRLVRNATRRRGARFLSWCMRRLISRPRNRFLVGLSGPVVAMEYLENGTFMRLMDRARTSDIHLPNRMLWRLFLCREWDT